MSNALDLFSKRFDRVSNVYEKEEEDELLKYIKQLKEYKMREADYVLFEDRIRKDSEFREALDKDLTESFEKDQLDGSQEKSNSIRVLVGKTKRGKSVDSAILVKYEANIHQDILIRVCYNDDEARKAASTLRNKPHSYIVIDEDLDLTGKNSRKVIKWLDNIKKLCREFSLNFIYCIKEFKKEKNIDTYLECFGYNSETGVSRCIWLNDKGEPLGLVYLTKNFDPAFYVPWEESKKRKWLSLLAMNGKDELKMTKEETDQFLEYLMETIHNIEFDLNNKSQIESFIMYQFPDILESDTGHLANLLISKLSFKHKKKEEKAIPAHDPKFFNEKNFMLLKQTEYKSIAEDIITRIKLPDDERFVFEELINLHGRTEEERFSYSNIIDELQLTHYREVIKENRKFQNKGHITKYKKELQDGRLGVVGEKAFLKVLRTKFREVEHGGEFTDLPDFLVHSKKSVISMKTIFSEKDRNSYFKKIGVQEVNYAKYHEYNLFYVIFVLESQILYCYKYMGFETERKEGNDNGNME